MAPGLVRRLVRGRARRARGESRSGAFPGGGEEGDPMEGSLRSAAFRLRGAAVAPPIRRRTQDPCQGPDHARCEDQLRHRERRRQRGGMWGVRRLRLEEARCPCGGAGVAPVREGSTQRDAIAQEATLRHCPAPSRALRLPTRLVPAREPGKHARLGNPQTCNLRAPCPTRTPLKRP